MGAASRYVTPDGNFTLVHDPGQHGAIGFEGYSWHTHDDMLASFSVLPKIETVPQFVDALESGRLFIALSTVGGEVMNVWVTDDPERELSDTPKGRSVSLRYWNGQPYHAG